MHTPSGTGWLSWYGYEVNFSVWFKAVKSVLAHASWPHNQTNRNEQTDQTDLFNFTLKEEKYRELDISDLECVWIVGSITVSQIAS